MVQVTDREFDILIQQASEVVEVFSVPGYTTVYFIRQDESDTLVHTTLVKNPMRFAFRQKYMPRSGIHGTMDLVYAIACLVDYSTFALPCWTFNKVLQQVAQKAPREQPIPVPSEQLLSNSQVQDIARVIDQQFQYKNYVRVEYLGTDSGSGELKEQPIALALGGIFALQTYVVGKPFAPENNTLHFHSLSAVPNGGQIIEVDKYKCFVRDAGSRNFVYIANPTSKDLDIYVQSPYEVLRNLAPSEYKSRIESMFWKRVLDIWQDLELDESATQYQVGSLLGIVREPVVRGQSSVSNSYYMIDRNYTYIKNAKPFIQTFADGYKTTYESENKLSNLRNHTFDWKVIVRLLQVASLMIRVNEK